VKSFVYTYISKKDQDARWLNVLVLMYRSRVPASSLHAGNSVCCHCRVKELGPGGPVEGKPSEPSPTSAVGGGLSPQKSDLALLRNANVIIAKHYSTKKECNIV